MKENRTMTHEQALARQAARPYGEVKVRRDCLRPGGWATRDASKLRGARQRYEVSEHGGNIRQFYEGSVRRILMKINARHAANVETARSMAHSIGIEFKTKLRVAKCARPLSRKAACKFMREDREQIARAQVLYDAAQARVRA